MSKPPTRKSLLKKAQEMEHLEVMLKVNGWIEEGSAAGVLGKMYRRAIAELDEDNKQK